MQQWKFGKEKPPFKKADRGSGGDHLPWPHKGQKYFFIQPVEQMGCSCSSAACSHILTFDLYVTVSLRTSSALSFLWMVRANLWVPCQVTYYGCDVWDFFVHNVQYTVLCILIVAIISDVLIGSQSAFSPYFGVGENVILSLCVGTSHCRKEDNHGCM